MNIYHRQFVANCPNNGEGIIYSLRIDAGDHMIPAEHIVTATALIKQGYHEHIADELFRRFGGRQTLRAHHHGVDIETLRGGE
jgi:hypothetical protein